MNSSVYTKPQRITLGDVCALIQHRGVTPADALAAYYAGRTDCELADDAKEVGRTIAVWEEYARPSIVAHSRQRQAIILAEVERRQLAASRGEVVA